MMRIAFVTSGLPLGGSTTFTLFLAAALRALHIPTEVFSFTSYHPLANEFSSAGVVVHTEDDQRFIYEDRLQSLYAKLAAFKPSAVFSVLGAESFELLRYLPAGVLRLGVFHDRLSPPHVFVSYYKSVLDCLVVVAPYLKEALSKLAPDLPSVYLSHGVPVPSVAPRAPNPKGPLRLLYYGRLDNISKGVKIFPEIVSALKRRAIPFVWTIHGTGPDEQYLKKILSLDVLQGHVCFSQPVGYDKLPNIIRNHDVYLLASVNEGGPLTLIESMSLGLVPVCGDIPCLIQEVITTENGFRVPRHNPESYAEAVFKLHTDRQLLESMSQCAIKTITASFSSVAMARRYISFLQSFPASTKCPVWAERIRPQQILGQSKLKYSSLARVARRIVKKLSFR
jgi:glycosyltransferase involved in cell wall biosynthesis